MSVKWNAADWVGAATAQARPTTGLLSPHPSSTPPTHQRPTASTVRVRAVLTGTMFAPARSRLCLLTARSSRLVSRATYTSTAPRLSEKTENPNPANDPNAPKKSGTVAVSETNAVPVDAMGGRDAPLQESPDKSRELLQQQAPNRKETWSRSQEEREVAMSGPRFEQTMMEYQVRF